MTSQRPPQTTLYILIPPSPLFAAHWSFFIPTLLPHDPISHRHEEGSTGRRIHVAGDRLNAFSLEVIRGYDVKKDRSIGNRQYPIGKLEQTPAPAPVDASHSPSDTGIEVCSLRKDEDEGGGVVDNEPRDKIERVCLAVDAPGPSLNRVSDSNVDAGADERRAVGKKAEVRDCQWWIRQVVVRLVDESLLRSLPVSESEQQEGPLKLLDGLPKH